jgi:hypothetical protein
VAIERMYTRFVELMAFMRMRSPNKAPPVLRLDGSTETMAIVLFSKSSQKRRTSSSTNEDFPAPPVPVMPRIGDTPEPSGECARNNFGVHGKRFSHKAPDLFSATK